MDSQIESDIAYIKAAVKHGLPCIELEGTINRIREELRDTRSKLHELDLFQSIIKGIFLGIGVVMVVVFIVTTFKASAGPAKDASQKTDASQRAEAAPPES